MEAIKIKKKKLFYLNQRKLPQKESWQQASSLTAGFQAIKQLEVRGAPLIGVFAASLICLHLDKICAEKKLFLKKAEKAINYLKSSRPTAVNLFWALNQMADVIAQNKDKPCGRIKKILFQKAKEIRQKEKATSQKIASHGLKLIKKKESILTHCNTGHLAALGGGTALGVISLAEQKGRDLTVYVDETRPLLQGSRLTAWELNKKKIKHFLITDSTAAFLMQKKQISKVIVGADRIAACGDVANKIGTYNLAVLAKYHRVPFYVAAPRSTFDLSLKKGEDIIIEERNAQEVKKILNRVSICPEKTKALNFAFDLTPAGLITAIITDKGIIYPPYFQNIKKTLLCSV